MFTIWPWSKLKRQKRIINNMAEDLARLRKELRFAQFRAEEWRNRYASLNNVRISTVREQREREASLKATYADKVVRLAQREADKLRKWQHEAHDSTFGGLNQKLA